MLEIDMVWWTVQTACVAVLLAAVVAVLCRLRRFSPAVKHALWLLVLVKLLTPPLGWYRLPRVIEGGLARWSAPAQLEHGGAAEFSGRAAEFVSNDDALDAEMLDAAADFVADQTIFAAAESVEAELSDTARTRSDESGFGRDASDTSRDDERYLGDPKVADHVAAGWLPRAGYLLLAGWLLGAIPLAIVESIRVARLARLVKQSSPAPAWLEQLVGQVADRLGVRPPRVVVTPAACSPLVCAVGRPCLIWPAALGDQLSAEARQVVLLHELAHLRRRDHWVAWLVLAGEVVWWFNPLYWYVRHQLCENAELACDAWVVGLLPSGRRAYARALIEVTEFVSLAPAAMPAVAMGNVARHTLERRLIMILRESTSYRVSWAGMGLIGLSLLAVLPSFSGGQDNDPNTGRSAAAALPAGQEPAATPAQPATTQEPAAQAGSALPGQAAAQSSAASGVAAPAQAGAPDLAFPVANQANPAAPGAPAVGQSANTTPAAQPAANEADRIQNLENQLHQLLDEVKAMRASTPASPQTNKLEHVPDDIVGVVLASRDDGYIEISIGSDDGLRTGQQAVVYREEDGKSRLIGKIQVVKVTPDKSIGKVIPEFSSAPIARDDRVTSRLELPRASSIRALNAIDRIVQIGGRAQNRVEQQEKGHGSYEVETLTRAKYRLPEATAQALAQFIGEHVKNDVEARVSGDTLTVIASEADQARINAFIGLLREATPPPAGVPGPQHKSSSSLDAPRDFQGVHFGRKR